MARNANTRYFNARLTKAEIIAGWCYLPFYLVLLSVLLQHLFRALQIPLDSIVLNIAYFSVNLAAVLLIFHRFLRQRFFGESFWEFLQACILGFVFYQAGTWAVQFAVTKLGGTLEIYNNDTVEGMVLQNRYVMLAISVVLAPVIEETLLRGLVFGSIRAASRPMAYITSIFIFTMMHNWQYFGLYPFGSMLLSCLAYVPASAALCWTYEKAGTIWAPITIHAIINALSFGIVVLP